MRNKIITVDCDGVIMENIWGRNWTNQAKKDSGSGLYEKLNLTWATLNHRWRKPLPGIEMAMKQLREEGYTLVMVTSRKEYLRNLTMWWLKMWGLDRYFDGFYFNNYGVTAVESKVKNIGQIRPTGHIDDNEATVMELANKYIDMTVYWLKMTNDKLLITNENKNVIRVESWGEIEKKILNSKH